MDALMKEGASSQNGSGEMAAAVEALQWAETVARRGDFSWAVRWLDRADELLGGLTPRYRERRRAWQAAADAG
jgi:hypothetical protein